MEVSYHTVRQNHLTSATSLPLRPWVPESLQQCSISKIVNAQNTIRHIVILTTLEFISQDGGIAVYFWGQSDITSKVNLFIFFGKLPPFFCQSNQIFIWLNKIMSRIVLFSYAWVASETTECKSVRVHLFNKLN